MFVVEHMLDTSIEGFLSCIVRIECLYVPFLSVRIGRVLDGIGRVDSDL